MKTKNIHLQHFSSIASWFGNQCILNFGLEAVCDIKLKSCTEWNH